MKVGSGLILLNCGCWLTSRYKDKYKIVVDGNYHKFTKSKESTELRKKLLGTGDRELVEVSKCISVQ